MNLEVGMYVRLINNYGMFGKIVNVINSDDGFVTVQFQNTKTQIPMFFIKRASHNIVDLIEIGDYVNKHRVVSINNTFTYASVDVETTGMATAEIVPKDCIKTIVTKEQFENNCYKIGDE